MENKTGRKYRWSYGVAVFLVVVMCVKTREAAPVANIPELTRYLYHLGWLEEQHPTKFQAVTHAINEFQAFFGLRVTGEFDRRTTAVMSAPRCGFKDKLIQKSERGSEYNLGGSTWPHRDLTYRISQYSRKLPQHVVDGEIDRAFEAWSRYTDLTFTKKQHGQVDIDIRFVIGEHGDGDPFDGPGRTLAHAYYPAYGGDIHFDDSEYWTVRSYLGTNLFQVAAHEIGHSLGLEHSNVESALMWPFAKKKDSDSVFDDDDIAGIQSLYGLPKTTTKANPGDDSDEEVMHDPPPHNPDPRNGGGRRTPGLLLNRLFQFVNNFISHLGRIRIKKRS